MLRREFGKICAGTLASALMAREVPAADAPARAPGAFPEVHGLTSYVAQFVVQTGYEAIPREVIELGKKSILDSFGLALAGSRAETGPLCLKYLDTLGTTQGVSSVIGTSRKTA